MKKRAYSYGIIALLIVMAVVLMLVANAWREVGPTAIDIHDAVESGPISDHGQTEAASQVRSGGLPGVRETQREANDHNAEVQEALDEIE